MTTAIRVAALLLPALVLATPGLVAQRTTTLTPPENLVTDGIPPIPAGAGSPARCSWCREATIRGCPGARPNRW
jgi:hypothetical protein